MPVMKSGLMFLVGFYQKTCLNCIPSSHILYTALPDPQVSIIYEGSLTAGHTTFFLTCSVMLEPHLIVEPSFAWTRQDKTSHSIGSKPHLNFTSLRTSDSGHYTCTVTVNITDKISISGEDSIYIMVTSK